MVTGVPVTRPVTPPAPPFDVFAPRPALGAGQRARRRRAVPAVVPGLRRTADELATATEPGPTGQSARCAYQRRRRIGRAATGTMRTAQQVLSADEPAGSTEFKGLPRRVRQANLAPQLRASAAAAAAASRKRLVFPGQPRHRWRTCATRCPPCSAAGSRAGHRRNGTRRAERMETNQRYPVEPARLAAR